MAEMKRSDDPWVHPKACDRRHEQLDESIAALDGKLDKIEARLYRDNGHKSIQTIINGHDQIIRVIIWIGGITASSSIGTFLFLLWSMIKAHLRANVGA